MISRFFWFSIGFATAGFIAVALAQETPIQEEIIIEEKLPDEGELDRPITEEKQTSERSLLTRIKNWFFFEKEEQENKEKPQIIEYAKNSNYIIRQNENLYYAVNIQYDNNGCISFSNVVLCGTYSITKIR